MGLRLVFLFRWVFRIFLAFLVAFVPGFVALAESGLGSANNGYLSPSLKTGEIATLLNRSLSGSCMGVVHLQDGLVCNPAFVPLENQPRLAANLLLSDGYQNLDKIRLFFKEDISPGDLNLLLSGKQPLTFEMHSAITFVSSAFTAQYVPYYSQLYSNFAGDINPEVQLFILGGEAWMYQIGKAITKKLYVGGEFDYHQIKVINQQFRLLELAVDTGSSLIKPQSYSYSKSTLGFGYLYSQKLVFSVSYFGLSHSITEINRSQKTGLRAGVSYSVFDDIPIGKLSLMADVNENVVSLAAKYEYGVLTTTASLTKYGQAMGIFFFIKKMSSGILFSDKLGSQTSKARTIYMQFGLQI